MGEFKKYVPILSFALTFVVTMCGMTAYIIGSIHGVETRLGDRIDRIEKDVAIIKTVLIMKDMMPRELAASSLDIPKPQPQ
jgi:hypothetical protein